MSDAITGAEFKRQLRQGLPKFGLFLNSHSPTVAEQLAHSGYDWLLVDTQHGLMGSEKLSAMLCAVGSGGAKSMVRVAGYHDRGGIQQALVTTCQGLMVSIPFSVVYFYYRNKVQRMILEIQSIVGELMERFKE